MMNMDDSEHYTSIQQDALSQLMRAAQLVSADMQQGLQQRGLTQARTRVLWELGNRGPVNQQELASILEVTPRNVTTLIDGLEASGFVLREPHPKDRRAFMLVLTPAGRAIVDKLQADMAQFARLLFGEIGQEELESFTRILRTASSVLEELARNPPEA